MSELMTSGSAAASQPSTSGTGASAGGTQPSTGASGTGSGASAAPKSFKISYEDGDTPVEFSVDDTPASGAAPEGFKFESLDAIKDTHADLHKALKAELSKGTRYGKSFKSPEEAASIANRIGQLAERIGDGKGGLDAIESALGRQAALIEAAQNGDKATVESWFKSNPEGMGEFVTHALENLSKTDEKLASSIEGRAFVKALTQKDIYGQSALDALNALYSQVADKPEAKKLLDRVAATVNQVNQAAGYKPDNTARVQASLAKREAALFNKQVDLAADEVVRPAAGRALSALTAEMKGLSSEERSEMREFLTQEFYRQLAKDNGIKAKYNELIKNKDQDGIVSLLKANRSKIMNEAAKTLYRQKLMNRQAIKEEGANKGEPGAGGVAAAAGGKVTTHWTGKVHPERGPIANFDFERMNAEGIQALDRLFYIKGDKRLFSW